MRINSLLIQIFIVVIFFSPFASAGENYNSCEFTFDSEDMHVTWNMSMTGMEIDGAVNPKEKIYKNLCSILPSQKIIFRSTGNKKDGLIKEGNDGLRHVKIEARQCVFDYYYGIKGNRFVANNNYNSNCSSKKLDQKAKTNACRDHYVGRIVKFRGGSLNIEWTARILGVGDGVVTIKNTATGSIQETSCSSVY